MKNPTFRGVQKKLMEGRGDCLKKGSLGQFEDLRGAWQEGGGEGVFERG